MGSKDRRRWVTLVSRATWALNWMHGECSRTLACRQVWLVIKRFRFSHRQSQRRIEELSFRALGYCRAWPEGAD